MSLSDEELNSITRAIYTRYGIDFTNYEINSLKRRVIRVIKEYELENSINLWRKIINEKEFIEIFINEVTVGLTEMFRNNDFWVKMREDIFPQIKDRNELAIWHAGCATGEEVYSMAICLSEENLIDKSSVIATDINTNFLKQAKEGKFSSMYTTLYNKNYLASNGKKSLKDYYTLTEDDMIFDKISMRNFKFSEVNLLKNTIEAKHDLILCRNVMIYFDDTLKLRILEQFHHCLHDNGFFAIGYYDSMPDEGKKLFKTYDPSAKIYVKR